MIMILALTIPVAMVTAVGMSQVQIALPTIPAGPPVSAAYVPTTVSPMTFRWQDKRLMIAVARDLLEIDFVIRVQAPAVASIATGSIPQKAASLATGALRLRQAGDFLVLLEYTGTIHGELRYQRRATMPILHIGPTNDLLIDARLLWATIMSGTAADLAIRSSDTHLTSETGSPVLGRSTVPRLSDDDIAGYQLDVLRLPKEPMKPRLYDPRISYLNTGRNRGPTNAERYIYRWRLEKQNATARVSDVVQPIAFRITDEVPPALVPEVRRAIEAWNPVLESVGFRNAIVVRLPTDTTSERTILVNWSDQGTGGTPGNADPQVDPRTGEILKGSIRFAGKGVYRLSQGIVLGGGVDPRTPLPLHDTLSAVVLHYIVAHEVGHALGLDHNFKASAVYPTDSLRHSGFLRRMGSTASVMAYSFINYVTQPEDLIPLEYLVPRIGPYDHWALDWGYRPIPEASTAEAELPTLERWRSVQDTTPYLQASRGIPLDPQETVYAMGSDHVKSADYALRNLMRFVAAFDPRLDTAMKAYPPYEVAEKQVNTTLAHHPPLLKAGRWWNLLLQSVANMVGGAMPQAPYAADSAETILRPIDSGKQVQAMRFVLAHTFYGQDEVIRRYVLASPPADLSTLILFDTVAAGWYTEQWQEFQQALLGHLVGRLQALSLASEKGVLHVLCKELAPLEQRLATATSTSAHARRLHASVTAVFTSPSGACR